MNSERKNGTIVKSCSFSGVLTMTLNVLSFPEVEREASQFVRVCRTESSGAKLESCAKERIHSEANFAGIVGQSSALRQVLHLVENR